MSGLLQSFIDEDFGYKHEGRNWGRSEKHSSLVVNESEQKWYWNSENKGGDVIQYLIAIRGMNRKSAEELAKSKGRTIGAGANYDESQDYYAYEKLVDALWSFGRNNREYWYDRKLSDRTIDRYRLGFWNGWNTIPLYSNSNFVNFQCRRDIPSKSMKYWYNGGEPVLMNAELLQLVDTIYMTEGTVDSLLLNQEGLPSVAHSGGSGYWNPHWYPLFSRVSRIYYIADNDRAGKWAANRIANSLGQGKVLIYQFNTDKERYDTVDFFRDGGTIEELKELIHKDSKHCFEIGELNGNNSSFKRSGIKFQRSNKKIFA